MGECVMSKLEEKAKKSKRIEKNKAVINKRVKVAKAHGMKTDQRNRFKKKHPLDCGRANCGLCSSPRKWGEKTMQEQKHEQKDRFDTDGEENKNS
jgi:hypothetical protein